MLKEKNFSFNTFKSTSDAVLNSKLIILLFSVLSSKNEFPQKNNMLRN